MLINGVEYNVSELARNCGVDKATIRNRIKTHPDWTVEQVTSPVAIGRYAVILDIDGKKIPLAEWAKQHDTLPSTALYRWRAGERDPYRLVTGKSEKFPGISEETKKYLRETRRARRGMPDEWDIACDLAGIPRRWRRHLKAAIEGEK